MAHSEYIIEQLERKWTGLYMSSTTLLTTWPDWHL